jgi:hypothetical protein
MIESHSSRKSLNIPIKEEIETKEPVCDLLLQIL